MIRMTHVNEDVLIERCKAGDSRYREVLYKKYCRKLMGICFRYSKNREEAEDYLQEGFYKIFKSLEGYKSEGSFEGWMRKILVNTILESIRRKQILFTETDLSNLLEEPSHEDGWNIYNAKELVNLINQLPDGYRVVFNLYAVEGYSHREIGEKLGINEGTSRSQYAKARKQLRLMIQKNEKQMIRNAK